MEQKEFTLDENLSKEVQKSYLLTSMTYVGQKWTKKTENDFSIEIIASPNGCLFNFKFAKVPTDEQIDDLINKIIQHEEIVFINRMFNELNELSIGIENVEEIKNQMQNKLEKKAKEILKEHFPELKII